MNPIKQHHLRFQQPKSPAAILKAEHAKRNRETAKLNESQAEENKKLAQIRALAKHLNLQ
jgi:hypothetical protein